MPRVQLLRLLVKVLSELVIAFVSTTKVSYTCFPGLLFFLLQFDVIRLVLKQYCRVLGADDHLRKLRHFVRAWLWHV